jgi:hypothetical protein
LVVTPAVPVAHQATLSQARLAISAEKLMREICFCQPEPIRPPVDESFLVLFFKKEPLACGARNKARKRFFLKKEAKTFFC